MKIIKDDIWSIVSQAIPNKDMHHLNNNKAYSSESFYNIKNDIWQIVSEKTNNHNSNKKKITISNLENSIIDEIWKHVEVNSYEHNINSTNRQREIDSVIWNNISADIKISSNKKDKKGYFEDKDQADNGDSDVINFDEFLRSGVISAGKFGKKAKESFSNLKNQYTEKLRNRKSTKSNKSIGLSRDAKNKIVYTIYVIVSVLLLLLIYFIGKGILRMQNEPIASQDIFEEKGETVDVEISQHESGTQIANVTPTITLAPTPTAVPTATLTPLPTLTPTPEPIIVDVDWNISASSVFTEITKITYEAEKAFDNRLNTSWMPGNSDEQRSGAGEWLQIDVATGETAYITKIGIINGAVTSSISINGDLPWGENPQIYEENNRAKTIEITIDSRDSYIYELDDNVKDYQVIEFDEPLIGTQVRITFLDVYESYEDNDLLIADIYVDAYIVR